MSNYTKNYFRNYIASNTTEHTPELFMPHIKTDLSTHLVMSGQPDMSAGEYIRNVSYQAKKRAFQMHGFKVNHLSLSKDKAIAYMTKRNDNFLDGVADYILLEVNISPTSSMFFALEAPAEEIIDKSFFFNGIPQNAEAAKDEVRLEASNADSVTQTDSVLEAALPF